MKASRGQSLIETLVALTVIVIGVMGAVSLGIYTIRAAAVSQEDVVAENLAREGLEAVRWIRDDNWRDEVAWDSFLDDSDSYRVEINTPGDPAGPVELEENSSGEDTFYDLCLDPSTGRYIHTDDDECVAPLKATKFSRRISIEGGGSGDEKKIVCVVSRDSAFSSKDYTVSEHIFDWF